VCPNSEFNGLTLSGRFYFPHKSERSKKQMAKRQRVYQRGKEYRVIGAGKRYHREDQCWIGMSKHNPQPDPPRCEPPTENFRTYINEGFSIASRSALPTSEDTVFEAG
jgi:hypothetical protein